MKKPKDKKEEAYLLGKASQNCKKIAEIFDILDIDSSKLLDAVLVIEGEIDRGVNNLANKP